MKSAMLLSGSLKPNQWADACVELAVSSKSPSLPSHTTPVTGGEVSTMAH